MYQYVLVHNLHTGTTWYAHIGTASGSGMYQYILVHNSTYWYVKHLYIMVYTTMYTAMKAVHAMKAPLLQLERVSSGTHYAQKLLRLPHDTAKGCLGTIHNMHLQNMIQLSAAVHPEPGLALT